MNTLIAVAPNSFTPVPFSGRAAFPKTLNFSWTIPTPPPEQFWSGLNNGLDLGTGNLVYSGPYNDTFTFSGTADVTLMGGTTSSQSFVFLGQPYYGHTVSLNASPLTDSANQVFVHGGTLTASVVVRDMHVYPVSFSGVNRATDSYDVSGVFNQGLMQIGLGGPLVDFRVEGAATIYLGDAGYLFYWARQLAAISVASITIDNGVGTVLPGRSEEGYITVYPRVTTTYTLTAVYTNGLTIIRTATIFIKSRKWSEMDMAQDHASGLITIIRSVVA